MTTSKKRIIHTAAIVASFLALPLHAHANDAPTDTTADHALKNCPVAAYAMSLRYQNSSEIHALQRQSWVLAKLRLDEALANNDDPSRLAVVTDLDETVLDNSKLLIRDMQHCHDYTGWDTWSAWERDGAPTLTPGAKEFLDYADQKGVAIYYISDRFDDNKGSTIDTLNALELPQVSKESVLLLGPPKEERRAKVQENHKIVLLLGDSLPDMSQAFSTDDLNGRAKALKDNADKIGTLWIAFPNATYGAWSDKPLIGWDKPMDTSSH
ncbi:5'-nucleotidase, lipoprotein e(P4) family [Larsenimonas suaedae]|uniref:HAD family acid phosphatase n=1 Tax=Larsenimonas suaedae TaxID=1851019 RepID=A0ABU1GTG6_9GAMM|nr:HAD family acid phosphatase [Larsenimonas suaedae]MCM2971767.1 5'-nucleotidase [Larsenimonas suaedae]MDR5895319.1 HAD family acid phosphatase [Larsenimonas suaedae]